MLRIVILPFRSQTNMRNILPAFLLVLCFHSGFSQTQVRSIKAVRTVLPVKIDGELNDEAWKTASLLSGFVEQRPSFGKTEEEKTRTEAWILYDDNAVYVSA